MVLIIWIIVFIVSMVALIKGADWLIVSSEKIGLAMGLSPFIVGVLIVGIGTSFPEVVSSLVAVFKGATEIVSANAVGSNIANILLIIGFSSLIGKRLIVTKSLINLDLPLLSASTALLIGIAWDKQITQLESVLLLIGYVVYLLYTIIYKDDGDEKLKEKFDENGEKIEVLPSRAERRSENIEKKEKHKIILKDIIFLILGVAGIAFGAKYLIDSVINISEMLNIGAGVIAITAIAIGTSLPELLVSIKAVLRKKSEMAIGNVFGSNVFNALAVVGIPGLFGNLVVDDLTFSIGIPIMAVATLLFVISGISRKIHLWEGAFYLCFYAFFIGKLFNLF
jgi:cation:H+ antiporter